MPATGVSAVVVNVAAASPAAAGYLTVFPSGTTRQETSSLNFQAGQNIPNLVVVPVGADGKISLYNGSTGTVHLLADVTGYILGGSSSAVAAAGITPSAAASGLAPSAATGEAQAGSGATPGATALPMTPAADSQG